MHRSLSIAWGCWSDSKAEVFTLLRLAIPVSANYLLNRLVGFTSVLFVGRWGPGSMSAAALGLSLINVIGPGVLNGLTGGEVTLCGQAFGAKNYRMVGLVWQRAMIILSLVCLPIGTTLVFSKHLLLMLGQTPAVADTTSTYIRYALPMIFGYAGFITTNRYLQAQGIVRPQVASGAIVLTLHPLVNCLFIYQFDMGYLGAAVATAVSGWLAFLNLLVYVAFLKNGESTWPGWSKECLQDWWPFIKLAIPSLLLISEFWAGEITVMLGGLLPDAERQLSAMAIFQTTNDLCFMISQGLAAAVCTRVSNELGAGNPKSASKTYHVALGLTLVSSTCVSILILIFRNKWGMLFTSDAQLIAKVGQLLVVLAFYIAFDGLSVVLGGAVRGAGRQGVAAPITLASYYLFGLPCAAVFAFVFGWGATGLCLGLLLGSAAMDFGFYVLMWRTDWGLEANKAAERAGVMKGMKGTEDLELQRTASYAEDCDESTAQDDAQQSLLRPQHDDSSADG